jgi:hypothetical protein
MHIGIMDGTAMEGTPQPGAEITGSLTIGHTAHIRSFDDACEPLFGFRHSEATGLMTGLAD